MDIELLSNQLISGDRRALAKGITLIESRSANHTKEAKKLLESVIPYSGKSIRIGISGVPGVGKSTIIESLGLYLIDNGYKVAVLAVDPTSHITGGSILGDKTRMENLSRDENAFIRPSPSGGSLGGVARKTRESIFLCEASGYDVVIVETVGVGQSEVAVSSMTDFFLLMQLPNAGDELQGIKRGIMEISNAIIVNKADGENLHSASIAKKQLENVLHILKPAESGWVTPVILASAVENKGIEEIWTVVRKYVKTMKSNGRFSEKRKRQAREWMWSVVMDGLKDMLTNCEYIKNYAPILEKSVDEKCTTPSLAAEEILNIFKTNC